MTVDLNPPYLNTANLTQIMHAKDLWQNLCTYIIYSITILWQITSIRTLSANNMGKSTSIWTTLGFLCFLTWMLAVQLAENLMELFFHVVRKVVRKELRSEQFGSHLNGKHNKAWCTQFQEISEVPMESYGILWDPMATVSWTATGEELQGHSEFLTHRMDWMGGWKPSDFNLQNRKSFSLIASTPTMQGATSASEAIDP